MIDKAAWRTLRLAARGVLAKDLMLSVKGIESVPISGPVMLVARHYHHLYDGCAILATVPRQVKVLVGLDWIERPAALRGMQLACRSAGWPVVFRNTEDIELSLWLPALRKAFSDSVEILRENGVLLVFPEGYPTIDPHGSPKTSPDEILPFNPGFARIAQDCWRQGIPASVVPIGFHYVEGDKWVVTMRFGQPILPIESPSTGDLVHQVKNAVFALSVPPGKSI